MSEVGSGAVVTDLLRWVEDQGPDADQDGNGAKEFGYVWTADETHRTRRDGH